MKRIIIAVLSSLLALGACAGEPGARVPRESVEQSVYADHKLPESVPDDTDLGGADILFLTRREPDGFWDTIDIWDTESLNGAALNDAIYERNTVAESLLNCRLTEVSLGGSDMSAALLRSTAAGDDLYQAVLTTNYFAPALMGQGQFLDLNNMPPVDLAMPWWDQNLNEQTSVLGRQYYATGALNIMSQYATASLYFNKTVAEAYNIPDLYRLTHDGQWTIDRLAELSLGLRADLDGDEQMNVRDMWGIVLGSDIFIYYIVGGGGALTVKNEAGVLSVREPDDRDAGLFEAVTRVFQRGNVFNTQDESYNPGGGETTWRNGYTIMGGNRTLFFMGELRATSYMRDIRSEYGLLPFPKLNEDQRSYIVPVQAWGSSVIGIPYIVADTRRIGSVIETLSFLTQGGVSDAFYDTVCYKGLRDAESMAMLDIMLSNRYFDAVLSFDYGGLMSALRASAAGGSGEYASVFAKHAPAAQNQLDKLTGALKEFEKSQ
ncbi:MAG: hypothetical protein PHZ09_02900 [Eubacteriales bacterium]|jgi:ABC-type glycerol-3-phosphate transport system substrate-binding protein|nr:hypothetical protein [Eubacteriales bacterium]